ncbi:putative transport protein [Sodalis glossinidius str. 'morsitans']|uniref:Transport protein n=1 Tax=Sodalis glossinidius (strain morsitans) TaxID=343509 RepID=Q2NQL8_SODGM|nr:putative transport protein [Sodalis glossinidius str. 'morsitans']
MNSPTSGVFRSLRLYNYRLWAAGALVSNLGTWMQNTGEDWLVMTQLTQHNASAVGTVMALQFGPQLLLLPWTGFAADHFNQHRLLLATQASMGILALVTLFGVVQLWHVYLFALLFGCAATFDAPVRKPLSRKWWVMRICPMPWHLTRPCITARAWLDRPSPASLLPRSAPAGLFCLTASLSWRYWCRYRSYVSPICRRMRVRVAPEEV